MGTELSPGPKKDGATKPGRAKAINGDGKGAMDDMLFGPEPKKDDNPKPDPKDGAVKK